MSLVLAVHTKEFAIVASDGRALNKRDKTVVSDTHSKVMPLWGNLIIAGTGDEEFTHRIFREASEDALHFPFLGSEGGFERISRLCRNSIREHSKKAGQPSALMLIGDDSTGLRGSAWSTGGVEDEAVRTGVVAQAFGAVDSETYHQAIDHLGREVEQLCQREILTPTRLMVGMQRVFDTVSAQCPAVNNQTFFHVLRAHGCWNSAAEAQRGPGIADGVGYDVACHAENAAGSKSVVVAITGHTVSGAPLISANASYRPLTNPLTATDAGESATISIAAFTMRFCGGDLSINSGSIAALNFATVYYIYYVDSAFDGGSVNYYATTTKDAVVAGADRFFVGSIRTPEDGSPDTIGNSDGGATAQIATLQRIWLDQYAESLGGNASATTPANSHDHDEATYASYQVTGNAASNEAILGFVASSHPVAPWSSLALCVRSSVPTNTLNGTGATVICDWRATSFDDWTNIYAVQMGETRPDGIVRVALPLNVLPLFKNIQLRFILVTYAAQTSGSATLRIYEAWIEGVT